ncbi:DUF1127 domain-containing protein [Stutzerimonas azotifigens]|uniref:DUF1127 domain-containing protein n=1 Tax=Stutzerimonas azotifigens TaxID=291995 RepID=UPI0003FE2BC7
MDRALPHRQPRHRPDLPTLLLALSARLALWRQRVRTRRQLAMLDARGLADIGISAAERDAELSRPFWR